jgi:hypothetical protein
VVVQKFQRGHGFLFLLGHTELVIHDSIVFHDQPMAEQGGPVELADERRGELFEGVGQNQDLGQSAQFVEEGFGAVEQRERADDLLDVEGEEVVLAWIRGAAEELVETLRLPRALYEEIAADRGAWNELRAEVSAGPFVDVNRLLMAEPAPEAAESDGAATKEGRAKKPKAASTAKKPSSRNTRAAAKTTPKKRK